MGRAASFSADIAFAIFRVDVVVFLGSLKRLEWLGNSYELLIGNLEVVDICMKIGG